ncbi:MAG TPA: tetratricopeptide repeat protein [Dongiaceae bacterium]|nr:tetratricopeptide repeat protein [Dongiaceae bacterium]
MRRAGWHLSLMLTALPLPAACAPVATGGDVAIVYGPLSPNEPLSFTAHQAALADPLLQAARDEAERGDFTAAAAGYRAAGEKGNPIADYLLAQLYDRGQGVALDHAAAARALHRPALRGYAPAEAALGIKYMEGEGVWRDSEMGQSWLRLAAAQGEDMAAGYLGMTLVDGRSLGQNSDVFGARDLLQHCAAPEGKAGVYHPAGAEGGPTCQTLLGMLYEKGIGVTTDLKQAIFWYHRAAARHMPVAEEQLAKCYATGNGVGQDAEQAAYWHRRAQADHDKRPDSWTEL